MSEIFALIHKWILQLAYHMLLAFCYESICLHHIDAQIKIAI